MNKQTIVKSVLALSFALAFPLPSMAFQNPAQFDSNGDGQVSAEERQAGLSALFTKIDANTDSYLSLAEMVAWRNSEQVERFNTLDTDQSTTLSLSELQTTTSQRRFPENITEEIFKLLDSDSNQVLSWEEYAVLEPGKGRLIRHFAGMDSDGDLQLSQAEFLTPREPHFGRHGGKRFGKD